MAILEELYQENLREIWDGISWCNRYSSFLLMMFQNGRSMSGEIWASQVICRAIEFSGSSPY